MKPDKDCVAMSRLNLDPFWPREVRRILELPASPQPRCQPLAGTREPPSDRGADTDGENRRRVMPGRSAQGAGRLGRPAPAFRMRLVPVQPPSLFALRCGELAYLA